MDFEGEVKLFPLKRKDIDALRPEDKREISWRDALKRGMNRSLTLQGVKYATDTDVFDVGEDYNPDTYTEKAIEIVGGQLPDIPLWILAGTGLGAAAAPAAKIGTKVFPWASKAISSRVAGQTIGEIVKERGHVGAAKLLGKAFSSPEGQEMAKAVVRSSAKMGAAGSTISGAGAALEQANLNKTLPEEEQKSPLAVGAGAAAKSLPLNMALGPLAEFGLTRAAKPGTAGAQITMPGMGAASSTGANIAKSTAKASAQKLTQQIEIASEIAGTNPINLNYPHMLEMFLKNPKAIREFRGMEDRMSRLITESEALLKNDRISINKDGVFIDGKVLDHTVPQADYVVRAIGHVRNTLDRKRVENGLKLLKDPDNAALKAEADDLTELATVLELRTYGTRAQSSYSLNEYKSLRDPLNPFEVAIAKASRAVPEAEKQAFREKMGELVLQAKIDKAAGMDEQTAFRPVVALIRKYQQKGIAETLIDIATYNKLTDLATHGRNITGNIAFGLIKPIEYIPRGGIDLLRHGTNKLLGRESERIYFMNDGLREWQGAWSGAQTAFAKMRKAWSDPSEYHFGKGGEIAVGKAYPQEGLQRPIGWYAEFLERFTARPLAAADAFFNRLAQEAVKHSEAHRLAKVQGLTGQAYADEVGRLLISPTKEMLNTMAKEGKYRTFQKDLGPFNKWIETGRTGFFGGAGRLLLPFFKTPANIVLTQMERNPFVGGLFLAGKKNTAQFEDQLAKMVSGASMALGIFAGDRAGLYEIVGSLPKGRKEQAEFYRQKKQPFSIGIDGKYYPIGNLFEPYSGVFSFAAAAKDFLAAKNLEGWDAAIEKFILTYGNYLKKQSYAQQLSELSDLFDNFDRGTWKNDFIGFLTRGAVVPNIVQRFAKVIDPEIREERGFVSKIQGGIPWLRGKLPMKLDAFGEPIIPASAPTGEWFGTSLPARFIEGEIKAMFPQQEAPAKDDAINNLLVELDDKAGYQLPLPKDRLNSVRLDPAEREAVNKEWGKIQKEIVSAVANDPAFAQMPPFDKAYNIEKAIERTWKLYSEEKKWGTQIKTREGKEVRNQLQTVTKELDELPNSEAKIRRIHELYFKRQIGLPLHEQLINQYGDKPAPSAQSKGGEEFDAYPGLREPQSIGEAAVSDADDPATERAMVEQLFKENKIDRATYDAMIDGIDNPTPSTDTEVEAAARGEEWNDQAITEKLNKLLGIDLDRPAMKRPKAVYIFDKHGKGPVYPVRGKRRGL